MRRFCPTLSELQAFDATARQGSFTQAAQELCITQGAVSKQVKNLEDFLGVALFARTSRGLVLTNAGHRYLPEIRHSLNRIEAASLSLITQPDAGGALRLTSLPSFSTKWLIPRLPALRAQYPDLHIDFLPHRMGYDFSSPEVDASIRFGAGVWPDCQAHYISGKDVVPVCHPRLFAQPVQSPSDLLAHPLLHHTTTQQSWAEWFDAAGLHTQKSWAGPRFDQFTLLIQAAIARFGTALVPRCLIQEELRNGKLIVPMALPITVQDGYYFCYPEQKSALTTIQAFRDWLLAAAQSSNQSSAG